ncbi:hypothetical protein [Nocardia sp. MW-W600-9]
MIDEHTAQELAALDADVAAVLAAVEPSDMVGPIVLANGMWANQWNGYWRVTVDRDGVAEPIGRYLARTLDECRRWAGAQLREDGTLRRNVHIRRAR